MKTTQRSFQTKLYELNNKVNSDNSASREAQSSASNVNYAEFRTSGNPTSSVGVPPPILKRIEIIEEKLNSDTMIKLNDTLKLLKTNHARVDNYARDLGSQAVVIASDTNQMLEQVAGLRDKVTALDEFTKTLPQGTSSRRISNLEIIIDRLKDKINKIDTSIAGNSDTSSRSNSIDSSGSFVSTTQFNNLRLQLLRINANLNKTIIDAVKNYNKNENIGQSSSSPAASSSSRSNSAYSSRISRLENDVRTTGLQVDYLESELKKINTQLESSQTYAINLKITEIENQLKPVQSSITSVNRKMNEQNREIESLMKTDKMSDSDIDKLQSIVSTTSTTLDTLTKKLDSQYRGILEKLRKYVRSEKLIKLTSQQTVASTERLENQQRLDEISKIVRQMRKTVSSGFSSSSGSTNQESTSRVIQQLERRLEDVESDLRHAAQVTIRMKQVEASNSDLSSEYLKMNKTIGNLSAQMKTYIGLQAAIKKDDSYRVIFLKCFWAANPVSGQNRLF